MGRYSVIKASASQVAPSIGTQARIPQMRARYRAPSARRSAAAVELFADCSIQGKTIARPDAQAGFDEQRPTPNRGSR